MKNYRLPGNPVMEVEVPYRTLIYNDLGKLVLAKHNEKFKGRKNIEDAHKYKEGVPISLSNTPRILSYDQIIRGETNGELRVLSPEEVVQHWQALPEKDSTYADTNSIALYPNSGPNEDLRQRVLSILGNSKLSHPLRVSGLGVDPADNEQGFIFTETDYLESREAPYLEQDRKVVYNPEKQDLVPAKKGQEGILVVVSSSQSGIRRLYRYWSGWLNASYDLLGSVGSGRVQLVQEPKARA